MAHQRPKHTAQQAQGTGNIYAERKEPKFGPKHPGVGVQRVLTRWAQSAHAARSEQLLTKNKQAKADNDDSFSKKYLNLSLRKHWIQCDTKLCFLERLAQSDAREARWASRADWRVLRA